MDEEWEIVPNSGNIFADLNLAEPEELLAKAALGYRIRAVIAARGWTQVQAAAALGIAQPNVSALMAARLSGFSIERLLRLLLRRSGHRDCRAAQTRGAGPRADSLARRRCPGSAWPRERVNLVPLGIGDGFGLRLHLVQRIPHARIPTTVPCPPSEPWRAHAPIPGSCAPGSPWPDW